MFTSLEIKEKFLKFFESKGHRIVPSAPIVVKNDPTLMFTNAGMNPFKDYFLGNEKAAFKRVANSQKCLRVSGKHNDLEEVGHDHYHHTMFEMLGNWSFGDYFKKEAIAWAWELLTEGYGLSKDRLYVTVFEGATDEQLPFDEEASAIWAERIDSSRILKGNKKDNFWEMGDQGPCGPCSEIHYDLRSDDERNAISGATLVNTGHPEVIEIWNLVFMQYNRKADGSLESLPETHVDTGMGFERLVRAIQNKKSNYDTDVFSFLISTTGNLCGKYYGKDEKADIAFRVIADHIRAVALCIADGQLPSNNGAGYVVRRILRRAVRYGYSYLGFEEPFLCHLVSPLADYFQPSFPELKAQLSTVAEVIKNEEVSFFRTLDKGMEILGHYLKSQAGKEVDGQTAFLLYDTFGFPIDLTELIARENGVGVDMDGFRKALDEQKKRSRADADKETGDWIWVNEGLEEGFVGYDHLNLQTKVSRYRVVKLKGKEQLEVVLGETPFYAESGGQIGDTGTITFSDGTQCKVTDTRKENKLHVHWVQGMPSTFEGWVMAEVAANRRSEIAANHSATHLLHSALKEALGEHVAQKGSLVADTHLRFDFSHFSKIEEATLKQIEDRVNQKIIEAIPLKEYRDVPMDEALAMGATALFGEKYGDAVRVIVFDPKYSMELCGGTHVTSTSAIRLFKITAESSVAAGIRRIEALTGNAALMQFKQIEQERNEIASIFDHPVQLLPTLKRFKDEFDALKKQIEEFQKAGIEQEYTNLKSKIQEKNGVHYLVSQTHLPHAEAAKDVVFRFNNEFQPVVVVLSYVNENKPGLSVFISEALVQTKQWDAAQLVREWAKAIQGGGGGQKFFATAGGKNPDGIPQSIQMAKEWVETQL